MHNTTINYLRLDDWVDETDDCAEELHPIRCPEHELQSRPSQLHRAEDHLRLGKCENNWMEVGLYWLGVRRHKEGKVVE